MMCVAVQWMASWRWEQRLRELLLERAHVNDEAVFDVAGGDAIEGGLNLLDRSSLMHKLMDTH